MEFKSLVLGLLFSLGIFAGKAGIGLHALLARPVSIPAKIAILVGAIGGYLVLFAAAGLVVKQVNLVQYVGTLQDLMQWGMTLHFLLAAGMGVWGTLLLRGRPREHGASLGWVPLLLPCPVCAAVILFAVAALMFFYPGSERAALLLAVIVFCGVMLAVPPALSLLNRLARFRPDTLLGGSMLVVSIYFILAVLLMPQLSDFDSVYRLAAHNSARTATEHSWAPFAIAFGCVAAGFAVEKRKLRRKHWST